MKNIILLSSFILSFISGFSQNKNVAININGAKGDPTAILDISSTTSGVLIPRMTSFQRTTGQLSNPANGLLVYQISSGTPLDSGLFYNKGTSLNPSWDKILSSSSGWSTNGNSRTNPQYNFLGTTDNTPLEIRVNNQGAGEIDPIKLNTYWGYRSGINNFSKPGKFNTGIGYQALYSDTSGSNNTAIGSQALYGNLAGSGNMAIGTSALMFNTTGYSNTANGYVALYYNTVGYGNVAVGDSALYYNDNGYLNTAIGTMALFANTTGYDNVAVGANSLFQNTTGKLNVAVGKEALHENMAGYYNVAIGSQALYQNTIGNFNVSIGPLALKNNTQGFNNIGIGYEALISNTTGDNNIATGIQALESNTTGKDNVASGHFSLSNNIAGSNNIGIGNSALRTNDVGDYNIAIGDSALFSNSSGYRNIALGLFSLYSGTYGHDNIALGVEALKNNTTGNDNIAIGVAALIANNTGGGNIAIGDFSLLSCNNGSGNISIGDHSSGKNYSGLHNVSIGNYALYDNVYGLYNVGIGFNASAGGDINNKYDNSVAIGYNSKVNASNSVVIGNNTMTSVGGYTNWANLSDSRFKKNIKENIPGLDFIMQLIPVSYNMDITKLNNFLGTNDYNSAAVGKENMNKEDNMKMSILDRKAIADKEAIRYSGFLAQDVEKAAELIGYDFSGVIKPANEKDHYKISYSDFVVPLVKASQELNKKINSQEKLIAELLKRIEFLENENGR